MRNATSPTGDSFPPSTLKPKPATSLITVTTSGCPTLPVAVAINGTSANYFF